MQIWLAPPSPRQYLCDMFNANHDIVNTRNALKSYKSYQSKNCILSW